ncbi:MAG: type II toxin-antitoxin system VapB family antitoxin [Candidatus Eremiobacteraeota bacterium]|nr:type II toxin-antitoxin system VapB family antitoxin [Candidatus Eremiobacteraeota bacterium]
MNIKNEETHRLAARLALLTGETMTCAVTKAIQERIDRLQRAEDKGDLLERAQRLIQDSGGRQAPHGPC